MEEKEYSYRRTSDGRRMECSVPGCRDHAVVVLGHEFDSCYLHACQGLGGESTREERKSAKNRRNKLNRIAAGRSPNRPLGVKERPKDKQRRRKRKPAEV